MVEKYISTTDLRPNQTESPQRVIKSYIKKNASGNYCIYDNDYYINIIFGAESQYYSDDTNDYDGYILKTDKFHLDTLVYRHPETSVLAANVVLFVGTFEIDFSKKLNKEFNPRNINSSNVLYEALVRKVTILLENYDYQQVAESLKHPPFAFLFGEGHSVSEIDRYFYAEGRHKYNFHFTGARKEEGISAQEEQVEESRSEQEPVFQSYEQFQIENEEVLSKITLQDFQKFRFYYEYKEVMKKYNNLEQEI